MPMPSVLAEGNIQQGVTRESCCDPARSETLSMSGSHLHRSWEVSSVPDGVVSGGAEKGNRNPAFYAGGESVARGADAPIVPEKLPNKGQASLLFEEGFAEAMEGRGAAKGNAEESPAGRTPSRETALTGLQRVRETAKRDKRLKFTALLHHITPSLLVESCYDLNKTAAVGVDGGKPRAGLREHPL